MENFKIVVFILAILIVLTALANKRNLPYPVLLICTGLIIGFVPQLPNLALDPENEKVIQSEWAVHEIRTTADFARQNKVVSWFVGGLNFQIEHHLFPQISHIHYRALSKIVRGQCELFGLPYNYYPSLTQAGYSHVRLMKELGRNHY
jgi:linoleoyl-CoA desaturase